ncbi:MAG: ATP-binding cassette domain-containing protein [Holophagales bacterium]|nr:ATP-binding cassette domain-containing protein [Holophagales bacterium]
MSERAIELRGIRKSYPRFALQGVDLDVPSGSVLGLVGPNGAGKSTLLRILVGLVRADAGRVTVLGRPMPAEEAWVKGRVGFVSEDMALYGDATLAWHMRLVRDAPEGGTGAAPRSSSNVSRSTRIRRSAAFRGGST